MLQYVYPKINKSETYLYWIVIDVCPLDYTLYLHTVSPYGMLRTKQIRVRCTFNVQ